MNKEFYQSVKDELFNSILPYWEKHSRDTVNKGFFGEIDNDNNYNTACSRSIVMTSRFLWTYSAVARLTKDAKYLEMAILLTMLLSTNISIKSTMVFTGLFFQMVSLM